MLRILARNPQLLSALGQAVESHSPPTYVHSTRVAARAVRLAAALGVGDEEVDPLGWAGILHDLGKVAVPPAILTKPGPLTRAEWVEIKRHPAIGANILLSISERLAPVAGAIRSHHEWFDGSGYPDGLAEDEIPLFGRILAISDVYDSLTAVRHYRKHSFTPRQALDIIESETGTHFDPDLVSRFLDQALKDPE